MTLTIVFFSLIHLQVQVLRGKFLSPHTHFSSTLSSLLFFSFSFLDTAGKFRQLTSPWGSLCGAALIHFKCLVLLMKKNTAHKLNDLLVAELASNQHPILIRIPVCSQVHCAALLVREWCICVLRTNKISTGFPRWCQW